MEFENQIVLLRKKANLDGDWKDEEGDGLWKNFRKISFRYKHRILRNHYDGLPTIVQDCCGSMRRQSKRKMETQNSSLDLYCLHRMSFVLFCVPISSLISILRSAHYQMVIIG